MQFLGRPLVRMPRRATGITSLGLFIAFALVTACGAPIFGEGEATPTPPLAPTRTHMQDPNPGQAATYLTKISKRNHCPALPAYGRIDFIDTPGQLLQLSPKPTIMNLQEQYQRTETTPKCLIDSEIAINRHGSGYKWFE